MNLIINRYVSNHFHVDYCHISLRLFDGFVADGLSSRLYVMHKDICEELANALGVLKGRENSYGAQTTISLQFHHRKLDISTYVRILKSHKARYELALERAREIHAKMLPLRNKLYDALIYVRAMPRTHFGDATTLSHIDLDRYVQSPTITYQGVTVPTRSSSQDEPEMYIDEAACEMAKIQKNMEMLRCAAAMCEACPRLFERHLLRIVKEFI